MSVFIIGEIGINHNGDLDIAKQLIDGAKFAGCNAVKFQKRSIEKVYPAEVLDKPRESPWGTTNREQKHGLEFGEAEYEEIDRHCKQVGIHWFASAWDVDSQHFLRKYDCQYNKVASAMLGHMDLLEAIAEEKKHTFISTGMHNLDELECALEVFKKHDCPYELMHCNSSYPMPLEDANLRMIPYLREKYGVNVGYSGHEVGLAPSIGAVALDITSLERHITLDRAMYGSDQAASVEIMGMYRLVRYVRAIETSMGEAVKKVTEKELACRASLKRTEDI